jgi:hypothetical protein
MLIAHTNSMKVKFSSEPRIGAIWSPLSFMWIPHVEIIILQHHIVLGCISQEIRSSED